MELKLIRTQQEHQAALAEAERLWDAPAGSPASDRLDVPALLIEQYERTHVPIADPDPIDFLGHIMEARGLTRRDLEPYIGPRGRVSDILKRTRPLTLNMIRKLSEGLIRPYSLRQSTDDTIAA